MPVFDWIQVEITTRCNAACTYCPHTVYGDKWERSDMSLATFSRLRPLFRKARLVYLQGWGEPFLNHHLFAMARIARAAGARVGTTTNGLLLDESTIDKIVAHKFDIIAFSLAGIGPLNDTIRDGNNFETTLQAIDSINRIKAAKKAANPEIHIAWLLLKSGLDNLEKIPEALAGRGIGQVVITTLDFIPIPSLRDETIHPRDDSEFDRIKDRLDQTVRNGAERGLNIHYQLPHPARSLATCSENIDRALFVDSTGQIAPCVFSAIPAGLETFCGPDGNIPYHRQTFGNINETYPPSTWNSRRYAEFRQSFSTNRLSPLCEKCPKRRIVFGGPPE